jgi:small-conductance mechanosensitive channel
MVRPLNPDELTELLSSLARPAALTELAVLVGCLALAWGVVRLMRGDVAPEGSIWFGRRIVDGVLFPMLALALAYGAMLVLAGIVKPAVFKLAVPVLLSLVVIRLSVRVLSATFPSARAVRIVERSISWLAWIAVVLWVSGVLPIVLDAMADVRWKVGASEMSLRNVVEGTLTGGLVLVLALWVSAAIEKQLLRGSGSSLSIRKMAANIVRALLLFVGLLLALEAVGIDLTALSVLGGAIGVGLGFGLQKIAANYISGFVVLAERSLRIGDMVKVDNFEGRITDIRTRYTVIRALNGRESIVPNEMLITQRVENSSLADPRVVVTTSLQVAYGTDLDALIPKLRETVLAVPRVGAETPPPKHRHPARPVRARRPADDDRVLDRRPGERRRQRALGREPGAARAAEPRRHRDPVPAAGAAAHAARRAGRRGRDTLNGIPSPRDQLRRHAHRAGELAPGNVVEVRPHRLQHAEEGLRRRLALHAAEQHRALGRVECRHHPAQHDELLLRRDAREQVLVDRVELGVVVVRPQRGVVGRLLDVHVLEVLGDEQRQMAIQPQRQRGALVRRGAAQRSVLGTQRLEGLHMLDVVAGGARGAVRQARVDRAVHEVVLVFDVAEAEPEQVIDLAEHAGRFLFVGDVEAADA